MRPFSPFYLSSDCPPCINFIKNGSNWPSPDQHTLNHICRGYITLSIILTAIFLIVAHVATLPGCFSFTGIAVAEGNQITKQSGKDPLSEKPSSTTSAAKKTKEASPIEKNRGQSSQIYKWVDDQGRTFYSSTKQEPKAELARLPEIKRIKDAPIEQFKEGCKQHGGASCDRGADSDGSIICLDGFRDSQLPYRFACSSARLNIEELTAKADKQKILVKNASGVQAKSVAVKISLPDGSYAFASGNQVVEPHSLEEFEIPLKDLKLAKGVNISQKDVQISCANCE